MSCRMCLSQELVHYRFALFLCSAMFNVLFACLLFERNDIICYYEDVWELAWKPQCYKTVYCMWITYGATAPSSGSRVALHTGAQLVRNLSKLPSQTQTSVLFPILSFSHLGVVWTTENVHMVGSLYAVSSYPVLKIFKTFSNNKYKVKTIFESCVQITDGCNLELAVI